MFQKREQDSLLSELEDNIYTPWDSVNPEYLKYLLKACQI